VLLAKEENQMAGEYTSGDKPTSDFEEWQNMREAAREASGGILIESSTDDPKDIVTANMFQPRVVHEQTVTLSHAHRPSEPGGPTEPSERLTEERYGGVVDGAELRADQARFLRGLAEACEADPQFDREVQSGDSGLISEGVRRAILKAENSVQTYHFLCVSPEVTDELARMDPYLAAVAVRQISKDLQNGQALPQNASYSEWAAHRNRYAAQRGHGRNRNG
jgi:hypothetical protein